jgi:hypothetical protein
MSCMLVLVCYMHAFINHFRYSHRPPLRSWRSKKVGFQNRRYRGLYAAWTLRTQMHHLVALESSEYIRVYDDELLSAVVDNECISYKFMSIA